MLAATLKEVHARLTPAVSRRVLNRTIVMPDWQCWCDQDWYASVLADCRMASSDLETPFRCPTDVYFHSGKLDQALVHFRMASFLSNPRVRAAGC